MNFFLGTGILLIVFLLAWAYKKNNQPVAWSTEEVISLLESWLNNNLDYKSWDYFEACEIADPTLEKIRLKSLSMYYINSPYLIGESEAEIRLTTKGEQKLKEIIAECKNYAASKSNT